MAATKARREEKRYTVHKHFYGDWRAKFPKNLCKREKKGLRSQERPKQEAWKTFSKKTTQLAFNETTVTHSRSRRIIDRLKGCEALANSAK
jgi:hypothetical protein